MATCVSFAVRIDDNPEEECSLVLCSFRYRGQQNPVFYLSWLSFFVRGYLGCIIYIFNYYTKISNHLDVKINDTADEDSQQKNIASLDFQKDKGLLHRYCPIRIDLEGL